MITFASATRSAIVLFLVAVIGPNAGQSQSIQSWPEVDLSLTVKRMNLLIPSLVRFDSEQPNPQFIATGAIGTFSTNRRWSVSVGYLFADLPQQDRTAHVPLVAFTRVWTTGHWTIPDINRFERLMAYSNQPYRYRNRFTADYAFGHTRSRHIYVSNEFFVNLSNRSWNQNRTLMGLGGAVGKFARLDAYFLQRSAPGEKENPVIGTVLTLGLTKRRER